MCAMPLIFNTMEPAWEAFATEDDEGPCKLLYVVNLCHISPWGATEGLFAAADKILSSNGHLCIYGVLNFPARQGPHSPWLRGGFAHLLCCSSSRRTVQVERRVHVGWKPRL